MKKRILSIILTLCMVMYLVPITASAMEIYIDLTIVGQANLTLEVESGDSIDNVKQKIQNETGFSSDLRALDPEHPSWASSFWWLSSPPA